RREEWCGWLAVCGRGVEALTKRRRGVNLDDGAAKATGLADRVFQVFGRRAVLSDDPEHEPEGDQCIQLTGSVSSGPGQVEGLLVERLRITVLSQRTQVPVQCGRLMDGVVGSAVAGRVVCGGEQVAYLGVQPTLSRGGVDEVWIARLPIVEVGLVRNWISADLPRPVWPMHCLVRVHQVHRAAGTAGVEIVEPSESGLLGAGTGVKGDGVRSDQVMEGVSGCCLLIYQAGLL